MNICLLVSGALGLTVLRHIDSGFHRIVSVFTNKDSDGIIDYCKEKQIPLFIGNPRNGRAAESIQSIDCDLLLSVNYLFIIEKDLIRIPKRYAINIHGSLLPKYRGRTPHVWAIINGEKEAGITAHLIDENVDTGDIAEQIKVPIEAYDTGASLLDKYNKLYPELINSLLDKIQSGKLVFRKQDNSKATYFGKRTPEDGRINWSWYKERIINWIRAQAKPYPGAFAYYNGQKIGIHSAAVSDLGFFYTQENGTILEVNSEKKVVVKTANGALELADIEFENEIIFRKGQKFE